MTDTDTLARIEAVLTAATDPNVGVPQRFSAQLKADGLAANTYPEALAVVRTLERLVKRTPFTPTATGIDVHLTFEQLAEQQATLAAYLAKAQDATEVGS